jgi:voltage-gated potassium channel Kch
LVIALGALLTAATLLLEVVLWTWVYRHAGAIHGLESSLYFSGITFTTVGDGDVLPMKCWRLLSVGEAINGVLMAGWSTAQLIFIVQRAMTLQFPPDELKSMASHQKPDQVAQ